MKEGTSEIQQTVLPKFDNQTQQDLANEVISRQFAHLNESLFNEYGSTNLQIDTRGKTPSHAQILATLNRKPPQNLSEEKKATCTEIIKQAVTTVKDSTIFSKIDKDIMYKAIAATACLVLGTALAIGVCAAAGMFLPAVLAVGALFGATTGLAAANAMGNDKAKATPSQVGLFSAHNNRQPSPNDPEPEQDFKPN